MFCPECKAEYRQGFTECSDCKVPLVHELPPEPQPEYIQYEEILTTFNPFDIAVIKSLLDAEGIVYYFHGEHFNYVDPLVSPARLMVDKEQAGTAREVLKDLTLSFGPSGREEEKEEE
jgi:hypothetical protein